MQQQITRGDYLKDLITIYIENNLNRPIEELYQKLILQCGVIQKEFTPAQVIKVSLDEQESLKLTNINTCYLAGITIDGHKETFNGSISFNTRGEVVNYEPPLSTITPAATEASCPCSGISGVFSNCTQPAIKAYFSLNYVPTKLSELTNDTDFQDSVDVAESISEHNSDEEAHPYIQSVLASTTEAIETEIGDLTSLTTSDKSSIVNAINSEVSDRVANVSSAISTTEAYADSIVTQATEATRAYADSIVSTATTATEAYTDSVLQSATTAINTTIGDLENLDTSVKSSVVNAINSEVSARENADNNLQGQIDGLAAASDVTDIVGTYQELQNYDTQHLQDNDIIKVLTDSTHDDQPSYYRYDKDADTFSYVGSESASYTKAQSDSIFVTQTTEINNHPLTSDINLTYSDVGALADTYATVISANTSAIAANTTAIASNTSVIAQHTTAIAGNTSSISTINGKIPTDASTSNKLVSASTLAASIADFANQDLSNLTSNGEARLHALKSYADEGELLTDTDGLAFVEKYAHSTFDLSKFTVVGSPTIMDDGIASGFSSSNYLTNEMNLALANSWEIITPLYTPTTIDTTERYVFQEAGIVLGIGSYYGWRLSISNTTHVQDTTLLYTIVGESIQFKITYNNGQYSAKYRKSLGANWREVLRVNSDNAITQSSITNKIGGGWYQYYFIGSIDLKQFSITVDGVEAFSGNKTGIDTIKPDDYTVVGSPTISDDGILNQATTSNYVVTPTISFSNTNDVDIEMRINLLGNHCYVFDGGSGTRFEPLNERDGSPYYFSVLSFNDQSALAVTEYLPENQWITIRLCYRGANSYAQILENGSWRNLNSEILINNSFTINNAFNIGMFGPHNADCNIDLNAFKIYVDGDLVYQPCLKIPYTESKTGSKIVNAIYRDRVNDMADQFGYANYYTLQEEAEGNYVVVGSPTISSDFVASSLDSSNYVTAVSPSLWTDWDNWHIHFSKYCDFSSVQTDFCYLGDLSYGYLRYVGGWNSIVLNVYDTSNEQIFISLEAVSDKFTSGILDFDIYYSNQTGYYFTITQGSTTYTSSVSSNTNKLRYSTNNLVKFADGSIDLKQFKIYVDNELAYEAVINPNFTLPQVELYGLIGQRTLRDGYRNGINYWELYSNRDLEQGGSCTSGVEVTFARPFADTNYVLSVPYSSKSATAFTPTQTGDWIAKGKGLL